MSMPADQRVPDYLRHMLNAIERVRRYAADQDEAVFLRDEKTQDAVIRNIEVIGEAARNVERADPAFATAHAAIPWSVIYAMRNRVTHGYFEVDLAIVWQTIQTDLPALEEQIRALLQTIGANGG